MTSVSCFLIFLLSICFSYAGLNFSTVQFFVTTNETRYNDITDTSERTSYFLGTSEIIVIVPGWTEHTKLTWVEELTDAYMSRNDHQYQVISVEWGYEADGWYYHVASIVAEIGNFVGDWIIRRSKMDGFNMNRYHVVSNSMGCQVAGFIGKRIIKKLNRPLSRITALDAAGPGFFYKGPEERLYKGDATMIVAIHTDCGWKGISDPYADIDFYPNGGLHPQPGCLQSIFDYFIETCSHRRARKLWEEAIQREEFYGTKCDSWKNFTKGLCDDNAKLNFAGDMKSLKKRHSGLYYTRTNSERPLIID